MRQIYRRISALLTALCLAGLLAAFAFPSLSEAGKGRMRGYSTVVVKAPQNPGLSVVAKTRKMRRSGMYVWQVEVPGGGWQDCRGDCAKRYRLERPEIWSRQLEQPGAEQR